tara:strand:+ start:141 stop:434 length:294 start_codon:yes stop_codon:yes gene_type:complete
MPFYKLRNNDTGEEWEQLMGISECDTYLVDNPHIERLFNGIPMIVGGFGDRVKTDNGFKEVLSKVAENNPHSALAGQIGAKDSRSVKVREIVNKHRT